MKVRRFWQHDGVEGSETIRNQVKTSADPERRAFARRIAFLYFFCAIAWIFLSDLALSELALDLQSHAAYGMVKGAVFVLVTSALLYWALARQISSMHNERAAVEKHLDFLSRYANDIILLHDSSGRIIEANDRAVERYGYSRERLLEMSSTDLRPDDERLEVADRVTEVMREGSRLFEARHRTAGGNIFPVEVSARHIQVEGSDYIQAIIRDITARKVAEARIKRLSQMQAALSGVNRAIVQASDEGKLFAEVCHIVVERAGFRVAWIGLADRDAKLVRPVAQAGDAEEYVSELRIPFDESLAEGRSLIEQAMRGGKPKVIQDIANEPDKAVWHNGALRYCLGSLAIIPLRRGGTVIGTLNVYATDAGAFDEEYMQLLLEMGGDVSFALGNMLRNRELRESEARFRAMLDQSVAATYVVQDGRVVYVNARMRELFGYREGEPFDPDPLAHVAPSDRAQVVEQMRRRLHGEPQASYSLLAQRRDGEQFTFGISAQLATYLGKPAIIAIGQDITEKIRAEKKAELFVERLKHAVQSTIEVVSTIGELRDPYTHGHERRVGEIAVAIAAEMGLPEDRIEGIRVAGYLHDVGKIAVPAEILSKPTRLSKVEFDLIKQHSQQSYEILKNVDFPWPVAEAAWQHHERMDGTGYPRGLKGEEIILEARVLAVADTVEAMASHRPYRPGLGIDKALAEIERGSGTAYDPLVADACLRLFCEKNFKLPD